MNTKLQRNAIALHKYWSTVELEKYTQLRRPSVIQGTWAKIIALPRQDLINGLIMEVLELGVLSLIGGLAIYFAVASHHLDVYSMGSTVIGCAFFALVFMRSRYCHKLLFYINHYSEIDDAPWGKGVSRGS